MRQCLRWIVFKNGSKDLFKNETATKQISCSKMCIRCRLSQGLLMPGAPCQRLPPYPNNVPAFASPALQYPSSALFSHPHFCPPLPFPIQGGEEESKAREPRGKQTHHWIPLTIGKILGSNSSAHLLEGGASYIHIAVPAVLTMLQEHS